MYLSTLRIENFKNITKSILKLNQGINCFVGENGSGKTNLLDAIHVLCLTKSGLGATDSQCINLKNTYFRIEGIFNANESGVKSATVNCAFSSESKKIFEYNSSPYERLSEHIGKLPLVMIAPDDTDLIREGSDIRRKFFDGILCQMNREYLQQIMVYNHLLKQRNAVLKQDRPAIDLLNLYGEKIIPLAQYIAATRKVFIEKFVTVFDDKYLFISSEKEKPLVGYQSDVINEGFERKFRQAIDRDMMYQRTTLGIHTDDYEFSISGQSVKKAASQGQKKSFAIALKLAQFDLLKQSVATTPILLLDDIFDKLDEGRMQKLIELVSSKAFGQIFVTDARPERSKEIFGHLGSRVRFFYFERKSENESSVKVME